jgi:DNA-binding phage protein
MALTRDFKKTIAARARRDARFREALFTEALNSYLAGNTAEGKAILRDLVNATVGFEGLAAEIRKPSKSLHRMLAPRGNPSTDNFFSIVGALQKKTRVKLRVTARYANSRIALDRLSDKDDPIVSSAELKRRLARKSRLS